MHAWIIIYWNGLQPRLARSTEPRLWVNYRHMSILQRDKRHSSKKTTKLICFNYSTVNSAYYSTVFWIFPQNSERKYSRITSKDLWYSFIINSLPNSFFFPCQDSRRYLIEYWLRLVHIYNILWLPSYSIFTIKLIYCSNIKQFTMDPFLS